VTNLAAGRHRDARLVLVSLAFLASAGFLGLHALATPGVLLPGPNAGFAIATPAGLVVGALFAAASASPLAGPHAGRVLRHRNALLGGLVAVMVAWGRLAGRPAAARRSAAHSRGHRRARRAVCRRRRSLAFAAWRYARLYRRRGGVVTMAVAVAFVLLAEALWRSS
jgi:hypothetical protein